MHKQILVVTNRDGSPQPALARALQCAPEGAELTVLDVVHEPALEGYLGNREIYEPLRRRFVQGREERLRELIPTPAPYPITVAAAWGHPRDEAVKAAAERLDADLVVVAMPPEGGLSQTDWRLVATCPAPVLVVRSGGTPYLSIVAAVDPLHAHAKPADLDRVILAHAQALQRVTGASLTALHCHVPLPPFGGVPPPPQIDADVSRARREALAALLQSAGIPSDAARLADGAPHVVLQAMAERGEADLIVMGVLARGRVRDLIIGNTAERVLHAGSGDVLAVKPTKAAT